MNKLDSCSLTPSQALPSYGAFAILAGFEEGENAAAVRAAAPQGKKDQDSGSDEEPPRWCFSRPAACFALLPSAKLAAHRKSEHGPVPFQ
jgi:hypothetical protein